jgi:hypothetical protein
MTNKQLARKKWRNKMTAVGLCNHCGKEATTKTKTCQKCLRKEEIKHQEKKKKFITTGICGFCGRNKLVSKTMCQTCLEKNKKQKRNREKRKIENNMCVKCNKSRTDEGKRLCPTCSKKARTRQRQWNKDFIKSGICRKCKKQHDTGNLYCKECKEKIYEVAKIRKKIYKDKVFNAYGGYKCNCCGETNIAFLTIDHINGGGNAHRREIKTDFYQWLIKNNFPEGFQVLCHNCQWGKHKFGVCPHQQLIDNLCWEL